MTSLVLIFGAFVALIGLAIVVNPDTVFGVLRRNQDMLWLYTTAIGVRVVLGGALLIVAPTSRFPLVLQVLGWIALAAAAAIALMGRSRFRKLLDWALALSGKMGRVAGVIAMLFGGFIVYTLL